MDFTLEDLKTRTPHPLKPLFNKYSYAKTAALIGCHPHYLKDILQGKCNPSADLKNRMEQVAAKIREAEKAEA